MLNRRLTFPLVLLACLVSVPAFAQGTAVKPYFLVIFDTSGSMSDAVTGTNSCGYPQTKVGAAKCVLGKIVNASGDAEFGLMQFAQTRCGGGTCAPVEGAGWLRVPIQTNSALPISKLINNVAGDEPAGLGPELCTGGYTPVGGSLVAARSYFAGTLDYVAPGGADPAPTAGDTALGCRPLSVIVITDGAECCNTCSTIISGAPSWLGCPGPKNDPAIAITCESTCASVTSCTNSEHYESAPQFAYDLLKNTSVPSANGSTSKAIRTYAIGFGIAPGDARIEHIAKAGGTNNGFYASNEAALSSALTQIISDAQPPLETCNNLDDDCDTLIDEGITKFCDKPNGVADKTLCDEPEETLCDGEDDDCDGFIDEGVLNACMVCGAVPDETCDGEDNDCDGRTDEGTDGGACGGGKTSCKPGTLRCVGGKPECIGVVGGGPEVCNCADDDCDGFIDENIDNTLCADGACVGCECIERCTPGEEFMPTCEEGKAPDLQESGECLCVEDNCDAIVCGDSTLMREDELACAPDDASVSACRCKAGMCVARCDGVGCSDGKVCNKHTGSCVENNCRGLGCANAELCDVESGQCVADACATAKCAASEVCRGGKCEKSCADVLCGLRERCMAGRCVADPCATTGCAGERVCDPASVKCVVDPCKDSSCSKGFSCSPTSGKCERDPCWNIRCPAEQACVQGECIIKGSEGAVRRLRGEDPNQRVLATGSGCACRVTDLGAGGRTDGRWLALLVLFGLCVRRRRLRGSAALLTAVGALMLGVALSACKVSPFCLDCVDAGKKPGTGTANTGGKAGSDSGTGSAVDGGFGGADGGDDPLQGCKKPVPETCDGKDEDCDFKVDEEVEADTNDCTQLGVCAGTRPICVAGTFTCRYPDLREDDETLCDDIDNDCDGRVDETFATLGTSCEVGVGACKVQGEQICSPDATSVRCEVTQTIDPVDELCDGLDNDCDGMIDEPKSDPGTAPSYVTNDIVKVGGLWIGQYEASRPDATDSGQGVINTRACSRAGVLPWTNLTHAEAEAACIAADMTLCSDLDWVAVCKGESTCPWSFTPSNGGPCLTNVAMYPTDGSACNGHNLTAVPGAPDTDALLTTGSLARCYVQRSGGDKVFDMSGNAKEWTSGLNASGKLVLRGGSYNNLPGGMRCDFDFAVADPAGTVRLANLGFRCCSSSDPN